MNDLPTHVVIFSYPNPDVMAFAVNQQICDVYRKEFHRPLREVGESWEAVGPNGQQLLSKLFAVNGVLEVELTPYEMSITKGSAFDWDSMSANSRPGAQPIKDIVGSALVELFGQGISFEERNARNHS